MGDEDEGAPEWRNNCPPPSDSRNATKEPTQPRFCFNLKLEASRVLASNVSCNKNACQTCRLKRKKCTGQVDQTWPVYGLSTIHRQAGHQSNRQAKHTETRVALLETLLDLFIHWVDRSDETLGFLDAFFSPLIQAVHRPEQTINATGLWWHRHSYKATEKAGGVAVLQALRDPQSKAQASSSPLVPQPVAISNIGDSAVDLLEDLLSPFLVLVDNELPASPVVDAEPASPVCERSEALRASFRPVALMISPPTPHTPCPSEELVLENKLRAEMARMLAPATEDCDSEDDESTEEEADDAGANGEDTEDDDLEEVVIPLEMVAETAGESTSSTPPVQDTTPTSRKRKRTSSGYSSITLLPSVELQAASRLPPSTPRRPLLTPGKHPRTPLPASHYRSDSQDGCPTTDKILQDPGVLSNYPLVLEDLNMAPIGSSLHFVIFEELSEIDEPGAEFFLLRGRPSDLSLRVSQRTLRMRTPPVHTHRSTQHGASAHSATWIEFCIESKLESDFGPDKHRHSFFQAQFA
ncbi:hypothetical protein FB45DRAFT_1062287 [Roridomyces roridus]|uniref:Uncharacterized protein n=1 Tax=Roridomyces roridus TaxID=1738132 RepID=A0AAD7FHX8_9AGAR|nr:hypothetical protein FB45DRAFT_1062287 [Roridomyces roridus]